MSDDVHHHRQNYKKVGMALGVLTVVTVGVSYIDLAVPLAITVALIIAATKGSLVVSFFMHLIEEKKVVPLSKWGVGTILATLAVTVVFFLVLIFIPIFGHADRVGEYFTLPNANAPTATQGATHDAH